MKRVKGAHVRTKGERERDLETTTLLYVKGKSQNEIAQVIGVSREQIRYDLGIIKKRWRESSLVAITEAKNRELARIDILESTYWDAWERSTKERVSTRQETVSIPTVSPRGELSSTDRRRAVIEKENTVGNPAYLDGIMKCIQERCRILGLYAPAKNDTNENETHDPELEIFSRFATIAERLRQSVTGGGLFLTVASEAEGVDPANSTHVEDVG